MNKKQYKVTKKVTMDEKAMFIHQMFNKDVGARNVSFPANESIDMQRSLTNLVNQQQISGSSVDMTPPSIASGQRKLGKRNENNNMIKWSR